jgi:MOSC domain-containing protein YiiM
VSGARVVQISVSAGGVPKTAVTSARVTRDGLEGDAHRDHEHHGGPDRAVCLYALEAIEGLRAEGHAVAPGTLGENLTITGLDWGSVAPGIRLRVGNSVVLEVTRYTSPCMNVAPLFTDRRFGRISQKQHPGWSRVYARVLAPGLIATDDAVSIEEQPAPRIAPESGGHDGVAATTDRA